jgi:hypothetical protein
VTGHELRETAAFARAMGENPLAAVDQVVRAAVAELARLGRDLVDVAPAVPGPPFDVVDAGRELDARLRRARAALLAAAAEYHHGSADQEVGERPW